MSAETIAAFALGIFYGAAITMGAVAMTIWRVSRADRSLIASVDDAVKRSRRADAHKDKP